MSELDKIMKEVYGKRIEYQLQQGSELFKQFPPAKLTLREKLQNKKYRFKIWLASKIAGFDVEPF